MIDGELCGLANDRASETADDPAYGMTAGYRYPVLQTHTHTRYVPVHTGLPKAVPYDLFETFVFLVFRVRGDLPAAYAWPLSLMSDDESMPDEFQRPEPFQRDLSSHRKTIHRHSLK